ncbi:MAG: M20/M25/M40 family metallo-hydrolase [Collinsella sp.]
MPRRFVPIWMRCLLRRRRRRFASTHPGKMHACGHDGHMAMALAAATLSTVRFVSSRALLSATCFCVPAGRGNNRWR